MPPTNAAAKKQPLTLGQISAYDDILTDALVDHAFYWTTIPKNRTSYHPSRGVKEEDITKIIQNHLVMDPNMDVAEEKLLATTGLRKFHSALKTEKEKDDFRRHLRRYMQIYLPDCPFEVSSTNRYTIVTHEAAVTARRFIKRGESIKYLSGIQVLITAKEEDEMTKRKKDFSIVVSSRSKSASLFMGPARFANHDCDANARLVITSQSTIEIFANRNIDVGEEVTVTYGDNYFGEDNCECLCHTCENNLANGWAQPEGKEGEVLVQRSIEDTSEEGYSLRRRRRDDSAARSSRTPSVAPDMRPRISKSRSKTLKMDSNRVSMTGSPGPEILLRQKRKREFDALSSPPITPAKRQMLGHFDDTPIPTPDAISRRSVEGESNSDAGASASESGSRDTAYTDITTPEEEVCEPQLLSSPNLTPMKSTKLEFKTEFSDNASLSQLAPAPEPETPHKALPTIETAPATGIPAVVVPNSSDLDIVAPESLDLIVIPPPLTPASKVAEQAPPTPATAESERDDETPRRGRWPHSPSKMQEACQPSTLGEAADVDLPPAVKATSSRRKSMKAITNDLENEAEDDESETPKTRTRRPGDYTLTPLLLSEPETAWIHCRVCGDAFVQHDAYFTRSSCPRCERHSKLYGYQWPKTMKEGKHDKEERILDHREIHRFLNTTDEMKIRGRKRPSWTKNQSEDEMDDQDDRKPHTKKHGTETDDSTLSGIRRSTRRRRVSSRLSLD
ncbi:hypothetical protein BX600DRAFT_508676 [Xylariales sp. PMI_506]|nr:hypothetical protein BX600DRAFT_508676 [Xylariales sp. PMI_506]